VDTRYLEEIGLSKAEVKVYLTLFKMGSVTAGKISKETNFRKSTVYDSLHRLAEKGLVSHSITNSTKYFHASEPERLIDFVEDRRQELNESVMKLKEFIPSLKALAGYAKPQAEAHVFQGIEGFKTMRKDVIKQGRELLMLGAISREDKVMPVFWHQWNQERIKRKIKARILHQRKLSDDVTEQKEFMDIRFLPPEINNPVVINIYGDRVVSLIWKEKYPLCFMLINTEIAEAYRNYFEMLWGLSAK